MEMLIKDGAPDLWRCAPKKEKPAARTSSATIIVGVWSHKCKGGF